MAALPTKKLGKIESTALGFGCMSLTPGMYGENVDITETEKTLRKALDSGVTLINTADFYTSMSSGELYQNLKLIAKVIKDYPREKIVIVMKIGPWIEAGFKPFDLSREGLRKRVDKALEVLGTDYVDVLVFRDPNGTKDIHGTSNEDIAKGLKEAVDSGKAKAIGVSEVTVEQFKTINSIVPVSLVELEWSLFTRDSEKEIIPLARSLGAGILAYSPMGRGVLTGKFDASKIEKGDFRNMTDRTSGDALDNNQKLVKLVAELAGKKGFCSSFCSSSSPSLPPSVGAISMMEVFKLAWMHTRPTCYSMGHGSRKRRGSNSRHKEGALPGGELEVSGCEALSGRTGSAQGNHFPRQGCWSSLLILWRSDPVF